MKILLDISWKRKKDLETTSVEYTESLDTIMLDHWIKCTSGDFRYSRKSVDLKTEQTDEDFENWCRIYDEYIDRFGLEKHYTKILKSMKKLAKLNVKYAKSLLSKKPDRFLENLINIEQAKLDALMQDNGNGMTVLQSLPKLSKLQGYPIRPHETTFIEYKNILAEYGTSQT